MRLRFGIPSLDDLITLQGGGSARDRGNPASDQEGTGDETMSLVGPDGTGKSVLALHLAAHYYADSLLARAEARRRQKRKQNQEDLEKFMPTVLYVSSDLSYDSANSVWTDFALGRPCTRQVPFERTSERLARMRPWHWVAGTSQPPQDWEVKLVSAAPTATDTAESIVHFLGSQSPKDIAFLDLASHTAGDDWNFVNAILARLPKRSGPQPPHLVIIDSIAGFETFVGDLDAHGLKQSRRSRVAQSMRNARRKSSLVFVVEEPESGKRLPEEYVTDVVLRLRARRENGRSLRTVEVEKARARQHALGEHELVIRSRLGSSTGAWENADDPGVCNHYVQIFHSPSHRNLLVARDTGQGNNERNGTVCGFGSEYLDELLDVGDRVFGPVHAASEGRPHRGLRTAGVSAIIGPNATGKSLLAHKFIADGFEDVVLALIHVFAISIGRTVTSRGTGPRRGQSDARAEAVARLTDLCLLLSGGIGSTIDGAPKPVGDGLLNDSVPTLKKLSAALRTAIRRGQTTSNRNLRGLSSSERRVAEPPAFLQDRTDDWREHWGSSTRRREMLEASRTEERSAASRPGKDLRRQRDLAILPTLDTILEAVPEQGTTKLRTRAAASLIEALARHPNLRFPGLLLSTNDLTAAQMADQCLRFLAEPIEAAVGQYWAWEANPSSARGKGLKAADRAVVELLLESLKGILEEQLIVRRFDMDSDTPSALFQLIHRNVLQASELVFTDYVPPKQWFRFWKGDRIRLVVDDFSVVSRLCPALSSDPSFLPFLIFWLEREGVASLFVHTDAVLPNVRADDAVTRSLQSLVKKTIHTWVVPFEGQSRIAVSVSPASGERSGVVREIDLKPADGLDWVSASHRLRSTFDAEVTPKLELYAGLDEGRPRLVPLAVYLFKGTSKFGEYVSKEDGAFRQLFTPLADGGAVGQVVHASDVVAYSDIRDRVHIPLEARAQHTTVFQVDGFWALGRVRSLASQRNYLGQRPNSRSDPYTDPFGLFRGRPSKGPDDAPDKNEATEVTEENARRVDYFKNKFYRTRATGLFNPSSAKTTDERHPDRVPFMWEFGFVTVKSSAWEGARREPIKFHRGDRSLQVGQVLDALEGHRPRRARGNPMSWREFLGACKTVSDFSERLSGGTPIPFDFASTSSETLNALLLEVWLSEIVLALRGDAGLARKAEYREWLPRLSSLSAADYSPAARGVSLVDLLKAGVRGSTTEAWAKTLAETTGWQDVEPSGRGTPEQCKRAFEKRQKAFQDLPLGVLCLYKTWLLLLDVLDIESLLKADNSFSLHQPKQASARALAARHWYRTACDPTGNGDGMGESVIVLRLPGHFITRGDSFLASPETSRSRLLAWQAMDLLSSRRSNLIRLQMGLGLPVRDVLPDEICGDLRTALRCANRRSEDLARDRRTLHEMTYEDLAGRGARYDNATKEVGGGFSEARWLFRNAISDYDRISRPIQKWLARLLHWTVAYRASHVTTWAGGFHAYDELADCRLDTIRSYPSFVEFAKQCDFLAADLEAAAQRQR